MDPNSVVIQPFRYGRFARSIAETSGGRVDEGLNVHKIRDGTIRACREPEEAMLKLNIDNIGDLAIVECEGRIVQSEAAFKLRDAVT